MRSFIEKANVNVSNKAEQVRRRERRHRYFHESTAIRMKPSPVETEDLKHKKEREKKAAKEKAERELREVQMTDEEKLLARAQHSHVDYAKQALEEVFFTRADRNLVKKSELRRDRKEEEKEWAKRTKEENEAAEKKKYTRLAVMDKQGVHIIYESKAFTFFKDAKIDWALGGFSTTQKLRDLFFAEYHALYNKRANRANTIESSKIKKKNQIAKGALRNVFSKKNLGDKTTTTEAVPKEEPPSSLHLPFKKKPEDKYVSASMKIHQEKRSKPEMSFETPKVPGWLIELGQPALKILLAIKDTLHKVSDFKQSLDKAVKVLHILIHDKLKILVTANEIRKVIRCIPFDPADGPSFRHFLFALANPQLAKKKGYLCLYGTSCKDSSDKESQHHHQESTKGDSQRKKSTTSGSSCPASVFEMSTGKVVDNSVFNRREQLFYSGLLQVSMHDLMKDLDIVYNRSYIEYPRSDKERVKDMEIQRNVGILKNDDVKKPQMNPYLTSFPICQKRMLVQKPSKVQLIRGCRSRTECRTVHMLAKLGGGDIATTAENDKTMVKTDLSRPKNLEVTIQENRHRIKQALRALAVENPVAALPDLDCLIHFTEPRSHPPKIAAARNREHARTLLEGSAGPLPASRQSAWVQHNWTSLYSPIGLPTKAKGQIGSYAEYTDNRGLGKLVKDDQHHAWRAFAHRRGKCHQELRGRLNTAWLNEGLTRKMFKMTYKTYLPPTPIPNQWIEKNMGTFV